MRTPKSALACCLVLALPVVALPALGDGESRSYFMRAKVLKTHSDGTIDFWVFSAHALPREVSAPGDVEPGRQPAVRATLEPKDRTPTAGPRDTSLEGSRISLRGRCTEIDRLPREPVLQLQLEKGQRWLQAMLDRGRKGTSQFQELATEVCSGATTSLGSGAPAHGPG